MISEVTKIIGEQPGIKSVVLVGVHGNEQCGVKALERILSDLILDRGEVTFIVGNPRAVEKNVRFTETNLNRMFNKDNNIAEEAKQSYEYARAQYLKKYLAAADVLFDVHASSIPNSKIFVICEANAESLIRQLPCSIAVSGFDSVEPGGTDYYMNSIGKIGICFECGDLNDSRSTETAVQAINAYLAAAGHTTTDSSALQPQEYYRMYYKHLTKHEDFRLQKEFANFETISQGQLIGIDGNEKIYAQKAGIILFAHNCSNIGEEAFLLGEKTKGLR